MQTPQERLKHLDTLAAIDYSENVAVISYLRMCRSMLEMANQWQISGDLEKSYVLKSKFAILFLRHLSKQPAFAQLKSDVKTGWIKECHIVLEDIGKIRKRLLSRFDEETRLSSAHSDVAIFQTDTLSQRQTFVCPPSQLPSAQSCNGSVGISSPTEDTHPPTGSLKDDRHLKPTARMNKYGWTTVFVPKTLASEFMSIAKLNTAANVETCATLCGKIIDNGFMITYLVFPKQSGTSDSCITQNEEELLDFMDSQSLIAFGWIHTHPSQTVFMSSIDLHCQLSYQLMLPEALAMVCSPKYEMQCFSLTPDCGIPYLLNCKETGFHKHSSMQDLYINSPHVSYNDFQIQVKDLR